MHDQVAELLHAGDRRGLVGDALLDVAVGGERVDVVVERAGSPGAASGSNRPRSRRAAIAMPTALPRPWPSGPVVVSTPGVSPCSGWPGVMRAPGAERLEVVEGRARSRTGRAGCTASGVEWPQDSTNRSRPGHFGSAGSCLSSAGTAGRRRGRGSSPCPGDRCPPSARRPSPGRGPGRRLARRLVSSQGRELLTVRHGSLLLLFWHPPLPAGIWSARRNAGRGSPCGADLPSPEPIPRATAKPRGGAPFPQGSPYP